MYVDNPHYATLKPNDVHHLSNLDKAIRHNDASMIDSTLQKLSAIKPELSTVLSNVVHLHKEDNKEAERLLSTIRKSNALPVARKINETRNMADEELKQIINAIKAGQTNKGVCQTFHISHDTLLRIKVANNLPYQANLKKRRFTDAQMLDALKATNGNVVQAAQMLSVWPQAIRKRLQTLH